MRTRFLLPALVVAVSLAVGACGSDDNGGDAANPETTEAGSGGTDASGIDSPEEAALAYAGCMRDHGIDFPDPQIGPDGAVTINQGNGSVDRDDPAVQSAEDECAPLLEQGGGFEQGEQETADLQAALLKFAQCMREAGVDFPDPQVGPTGGVIMQPGPGVDPNGAEFQNALAECQSLMSEFSGG